MDNASMAIRNKVRDYIEQLGITPYKFAQRTGVAKNTVYSLINNPEHMPAPQVMDKIYKAYPSVEPNDLLQFVPDEQVAA